MTSEKRTQLRAVTITGTRSISPRFRENVFALFETYLLPFAESHPRFHIGGALGIDTLALEWLAERTAAAISVVVPCTVADQPPEARQVISSAERAGRLADLVELAHPELGTAAYHTRNRWMVDRSELVIGFPRGNDQGSGTWYTINYAADQRKPRLVVPI